MNDLRIRDHPIAAFTFGLIQGTISEIDEVAFAVCVRIEDGEADADGKRPGSRLDAACQPSLLDGFANTLSKSGSFRLIRVGQVHQKCFSVIASNSVYFTHVLDEDRVQGSENFIADVVTLGVIE